MTTHADKKTAPHIATLRVDIPCSFNATFLQEVHELLAVLRSRLANNPKFALATDTKFALGDVAKCYVRISLLLELPNRDR